MNIEDRTVWQQACGGEGRDYADLCIRWGVILNGPGHPGPFDPALYGQSDLSARKVTDLRRFAEEMSDGDVVVLRLGTARALAVGEIVGGYEWHDGFADVDGWDLQHVRRVRWLWHDLAFPDTLDTYTFKLGDTTQRLTTEKALAWLASKTVGATTDLTFPDLLGCAAPAIELEKVFAELFGRGLDGAAIDRLSQDLSDLCRLARWYRLQHHDSKSWPSEYETVAYLVTPFLRAIGWTPQRMAVEWHRIDVALFSRLPRMPEHIGFVVEAKQMDASCLSAHSQAADYANAHGCTQVVVTDGVRYGVFIRDTGEFRLHAYLNLLDLRSAYPVLGAEGQPCLGAAEAIWRLTPEFAL